MMTFDYNYNNSFRFCFLILEIYQYPADLGFRKQKLFYAQERIYQRISWKDSL